MCSFWTKQMKHVLEYAEDGHQQVGQCQICQEKVGRSSHWPMNANNQDRKQIS